MKKWRTILIILLVILSIGALAVYYVFNKPHRTVETEKAIIIMANDLFLSFTQNEKQANALYLDKTIQVSGEVVEVRINQDNKSMLVLKTDDPIFGVVCTFTQNIGNQVKGSTVIVKGFCSGYDGNDVKLRDCILSGKP